MTIDHDEAKTLLAIVVLALVLMPWFAKRECLKCNGSGRDRNGNACEDCDGSGRI